MSVSIHLSVFNNISFHQTFPCSFGLSSGIRPDLAASPADIANSHSLSNIHSTYLQENSKTKLETAHSFLQPSSTSDSMHDETLENPPSNIGKVFLPPRQLPHQCTTCPKLFERSVCGGPSCRSQHRHGHHRNREGGQN